MHTVDLATLDLKTMQLVVEQTELNLGLGDTSNTYIQGYI